MSAAAAPVAGLFDCRDTFSRTLESLAESDPRIVTVVSDSVGSSKLVNFRKRWPERMVNVGIAEQAMVGVGAGLANGGKIPFVSGAACFLTGRALEQIKADVAYSQANVKLCGISSGVAYGELGPTHHSIEDLAWLRPMANLTIIVPADPWETGEAIRAAAALDGPVFVRISRMPVPALTHTTQTFEIGKAETLREGGDAAIIAGGKEPGTSVPMLARLDKREVVWTKELPSSNPLTARHDEKLESLRGEIVGSLGRIHAVLEPAQRERLADIIESGLRRGFGPYRV